MERVDAVVVGARLAGCAVAAPLARAGRRVLVLDRMRFPSDQLSTHVLMPAGTSELAKLGALPRILSPESVAGPLRPCRGRRSRLPGAGPPGRRRDRLRSLRATRPSGRSSSSSRRASRAPRSGSAAALRRCAGARVASRACATATRTGSSRRWSATLVIGADGRRSTVASLVGAWTPYRLSRNGRGLVFRYLEDPLAGTVRGRDLLPVARGQLVRVRVPHHSGGQAADSPDGPPRRGERGQARPRGATGGGKLRRAPRPRRRGSRVRHRDRSCARPGTRRRSSAPPRGRGGRWRATPDTSRTPSPARGCATRCSPGARLPSRSCRSSTTRSPSTARPAAGRPPATVSACPPTTSPTPTPASSAPLPRSASWSATAGRTTDRRTSATCSAAPVRCSRSRRRPRLRASCPSWPSARRAARARKPWCGRSRTAAHGVRDRARAPRRPVPLDAPGPRLRAPGRDWPSTADEAEPALAEPPAGAATR